MARKAELTPVLLRWQSAGNLIVWQKLTGWMPQRRSEESRMQGMEERRRPEDSMQPETIRQVVVLEEPEAPGHSLYLGSPGQEQNCCYWQGPENDSRGQERAQGLRCHEHHRQGGIYAWQIINIWLAQDEKSAPGATEGGIASASRARREWRDSGEMGCMVILSEIEELSVGPELNEVRFKEEGARDYQWLPSSVSNSNSPSGRFTAKTTLPNLPQMNLAEQHVPGSKNTYYIPDFVTTDEETFLLRKVSWQP